MMSKVVDKVRCREHFTFFYTDGSLDKFAPKHGRITVIAAKMSKGVYTTLAAYSSKFASSVFPRQPS